MCLPILLQPHHSSHQLYKQGAAVPIGCQVIGSSPKVLTTILTNQKSYSWEGCQEQSTQALLSNLSDLLLTQWRSSTGLGKPCNISPLSAGIAAPWQHFQTQSSNITAGCRLCRGGRLRAYLSLKDVAQVTATLCAGNLHPAHACSTTHWVRSSVWQTLSVMTQTAVRLPIHAGPAVDAELQPLLCKTRQEEWDAHTP